MIPENIINAIKEAAKIEDVIGDYIQLTKSGKDLKCCCPFHAERTPSFFVSPLRNTYHCFGCGKSGDAIQFLMDYNSMDFTEAVRQLGKKYSIEVEDREPTAAEMEEQKRYESLMITLAKAEELYHACFLKSPKAQEYAYSRWGKEVCEKMHIGYSEPSGMTLNVKDIIQPNLETLRIINLYHDDIFRGRIIIPIHNVQGKTVGFTARKMPDASDDTAKYINSYNTTVPGSKRAIYEKSREIFGIDHAREAARKDQKIYLVEGASDALRLYAIGIDNVVAPLGTALAPAQLNILKKYTSQLCFMPDSDPPKDGQQFGPGILAVINNGRAALQQGFSVLVKQIPMGNEKQDPGSYYTTRERFDEIKPEDFVTWYATLLMGGSETTTERSEAIGKIAEAISYVADETQRAMYLTDFSKKYGGKVIWRKAVEKADKEFQLVTLRERTRTVSKNDMTKEYGFYIDHNCYISVGGENDKFEWSNFILEPLYLIRDIAHPKRMYKMINVDGQEAMIVLTTDDLVALPLFQKKVEAMGNYIWKATQKEITKMKTYLYKHTVTAYPIEQMGWNKAGFFAWGNGIYYNGRFLETDNFGIVHIPKLGYYYLPSNSEQYRDDDKFYSFEHTFIHRPPSKVTLRQMTDCLFDTYGDNGRVGFCYALATLYRDIIFKRTDCFPILDLFGPRGTGKSDMARVLMSFFYTCDQALTLVPSTVAALGTYVGSVANALVHIEEYKNIIDVKKLEFLKGIWGGQGRTKRSMEVDNANEKTAVNCGVVMSGQEIPTADNALFSRLVWLRFPKSEFTENDRRNHQRLMEMVNDGFTHLTEQLLDARGDFMQAFPPTYDIVFKEFTAELATQHIADRLLKNYAIVLSAYRVMEQRLHLSLSYTELFAICKRFIIVQHSSQNDSSELGRFWEFVQYLFTSGELNATGDFRVDDVSSIKIEGGMEFNWEKPHRLLFLQKSRIFVLYETRKTADNSNIPAASLKYYLENATYYLGEKRVRFNVFAKGQQQYEVLDSQHRRKKSQVQRAYCFDYTQLKELFNINLETDAGVEETPDSIGKEEDDDTPF